MRAAMAFSWLPVLLLLGLSLTQAADPVVKVAQGSLQGTAVQGGNGTKSYLAFRGIPYGQPPVGDLRFKAPRPAKSWTGVRAATAEGNPCTQPTLQGTVIGSDDCLYLNVYTPTVTCEAPLPVIVWYFGGAFSWGDGGVGWYGPDFLVNRDVVVVSPNYRVGPPGFLNLETEAAPGNAGLKDAKLVLEWTKQNARSFCGDPNQVTVAGFSAGSMISHALALNPRSQGLFQRAYLMSGNAMSPLAHRADHLQQAKAVAAQLGATDTSIAGLQKTFTEATSKQICEAYLKVLLSEPYPFFAPRFVMSTEKVAASEADLKGSTMLDTDLVSLATTGAVKKPVPMLVGHTRSEGLFVYLLALAEQPTPGDDKALLQRLTSRFSEVLQELVYPGIAPAKQEQAKQLLEKAYFGGKSTFDRDAFGAMAGGAVFTGPTVNYLRYCRGDVSLYEVDVETDYNFVSQHVFKVSYHTSAVHGDDIGYLFRPNAVDLQQDIRGTGVDAATLRYISALVTDFAKGKKVGVRATCGSSSNAQPYVHVNGKTLGGVARGFASEHAVWREIFDLRGH